MKSFHLGFPISDIDEACSFYRDLLGCEIVSRSGTTINIDFFGHQVVGHVIPGFAGKHGTNEIDGNQVPVHHFGAVLDWADWEELVDTIEHSDVDFLIGPYVRDRGTPEEEGKLFIQDPDGNTLEFKTFKNESHRFA